MVFEALSFEETPTEVNIDKEEKGNKDGPLGSSSGSVSSGSGRDTKAKRLRRSCNGDEESQCEVPWKPREETYFKQEAGQLCLMLLNDLSRSRSMVILMQRVLVGQK